MRREVAEIAAPVVLAVVLGCFSIGAYAADFSASADAVRGDAIRVRWDAPSAGPFTVKVWTTNHFPEAGTVVASYDFDKLSNPGGNEYMQTEEIVAAYPGLDGSTLLSLPANSVGQIKVSNGDNRGVLSCDAGGDYSRLFLLAVLKRHDYRKEAKIMAIGWEHPAGTTNLLMQTDSAGRQTPFYVRLELEFTRAIVPLDGIPSGVKLLLNAPGPSDKTLPGYDRANKKTDHRIIFDRIDFIRDWEPERTETNLVATASVRNRNSAWIEGLTPETDYMVTVAAQDGGAGEAVFSVNSGPLSRPSFAIVLR